MNQYPPEQNMKFKQTCFMPKFFVINKHLNLPNQNADK